MKLFSNLYEKELDSLFFVKPARFNKHTQRDELAYALGATLYMPATRENIHQELLLKKHDGLASMVICLEDSIADHEVDKAEKQLVAELNHLADALGKGYLSQDELPLIFVRIRSLDQLENIAEAAGEALKVLTGIVIPKFEPVAGKKILKFINQLNTTGDLLYAMPILETKKIIEKETRLEELLAIKAAVDEFRELILNVRIGATDFSGLYGIRRNADTTVYDIGVIRDCISDIVNVFLRFDSPYVVSGPVWEYFSSTQRILKPQLRQTPFGQEGLKWRTELIDRHMDGLIQEIMMDIANGLTGKTIIHPSHIKTVHALNAVSYEEYIDAKNIVEEAENHNGVRKSAFANKMNEIKPHYYWAQKILRKSQVYGVLQDGITNIDLLKQEIFISNS
ncbi:HpcH/HpaI aldolase/citrate lyase family protein [Mesobacillus subterraneus]|uniref:HpcH/HpaI aldolase/citrate lyase family protein n=1 Tax=Mesobacillus subterraneus TaxID=285983 RepID=UPI00203AAC53|nr:HpcH/HpaI aldolase/citrate lyase family protein [Mesobacillus subterraneus]MCM3682428.1 HpcH/HpaI aldolase/citrate lyase family protein [Mesobacillus subterraneus]